MVTVTDEQARAALHVIGNSKSTLRKSKTCQGFVQSVKNQGVNLTFEQLYPEK